MSENHLTKDHLRLRILLTIASATLLLSLVVVGVRAFNRPWRVVQRQFSAMTGETAPGIRQYRTCADEVDRCPTCHLGMERNDISGKKPPLPFRNHGPDIGEHDPWEVGCTACHGGVGRALTPAAAHGTTMGGARDPLMKAPYIQASCARCHMPGEKPGQERLLQGATLYAGLGCPGCHPLTDQGCGGWDYGPDLRALGRMSPDALKTSLLDPAANFEGSTMPSFEHALEKDQSALESLLIYLESLALPRSDKCRARDRKAALVRAPCTTCHADEAGRASGRVRHRCPYILERKEELKCSNCHALEVPGTGAAKGYCPLITAHREACALCHEEKGD